VRYVPALSPRAKIVLHDLCMTALAWSLAVAARFNFALPPPEFLHAALRAVPVAVAIQGLLAWRFGLYRGVWRFASLPDLWNIIRAAALGALLSGIALFLLNRLVGIPRSVLLFYPLFLVFLLGGPRLVYRLWKDRSLTWRAIGTGPRALVIGGGSGGELVVRDMLRGGAYLPVGILDDDPRLLRGRIHGVPVLGAIEQLREVLTAHDVDLLVIAIPSATTAQMRRIVDLCEASGKPVRTLPPLRDLGAGGLGVQSLREVSIDDLLGRDSVVLDWGGIQAGVAGKVVLVSGGGGSIGAELCRQLARLGVARLVVFERSEHALYLVERELRERHPHLPLTAVIGDVGDRAALDHLFQAWRPALIFHAAAYKHVPILQGQVREAVRNNVLGTLEMVEAAERHQAEAFVLISTDKAVRPSSVMGATKRVAELLCETRNRRSPTRFITVRFGNVLGSAGSVVPLFREQIAAGGPVTVTHPEARRYFMTIPEASQLILQAGTAGRGGEIFVLDMGEPVSITYLAEQMIRLSGRVPGADIAIVYTGLRPGEKLNETLFRDDERLVRTGHDKLLLAQHSAVDPRRLAEQVAAMARAVAGFDEAACERLLIEAVPELARGVSADAANVVSINRSQ